MSQASTIQKKTLELQLHSYWHAGSGLGSATGVDAQVSRTPGGLPYLPGRSLKGILREAVEQAAALGWADASDADIASWFGTGLLASSGAGGGEPIDQLEEARFTSRPGSLRIGSARIGRGDEAGRWERWAAWPGHHVDRDLLFSELASTALNDEGTARPATLRLIEVAAPLSLHATIAGPPDALAAIAVALPLVRSIGAHRTRGLGRVTLRMGEEA